MKKIILISIVFAFLSCKEDEKKGYINKKLYETDTKKGNEIKDDIFNIIIEAKFLEDDKIELYYLGEFAEDSFNIKERLAVNVKGRSDFQTIQFSLPKDILPYKFRIDLGDNAYRQETQIEIKSIQLKLNGNDIFIDNELLNSFFEHNSYLERNESGYLRRVVDDRYDPFLISKPVLNAKIELEL